MNKLRWHYCQQFDPDPVLLVPAVDVLALLDHPDELRMALEGLLSERGTPVAPDTIPDWMTD